MLKKLVVVVFTKKLKEPEQEGFISTLYPLTPSWVALIGAVHIRKICVPDTAVALSLVGGNGTVGSVAKADKTLIGETNDPKRRINPSDIPNVFTNQIFFAIGYNHLAEVISRISTQS